MNPHLWQRPWRLMLAVNTAVLAGVFLHKITLPPFVPYIHLLVDYHFGFTKRALIGAIVSLFTAKVPVWLVFALGGVAWLITLGLFLELFRRTFGFSEGNMPLLVLMAGSPFFLKNFMYTLGHFDIYGCALAIVLLLIPARSIAFVACATLFSMALILIHHIHFLMYLPTIAVIVVLRHYLAQGLTRANALVGFAAAAAVAILFVAAEFHGTIPIPEADFVRYLQTRMADPSRTDLLIWLHTPLWRYFAELIGALSDKVHRRIVIAAIVMVSGAYLIIFATVFDYSRWISNWAVCMFLILHAVKLLPSSQPIAPIPADDKKATIFGWIVTLIPRVGIVRPF
jgi:hypothetical protein